MENGATPLRNPIVKLVILMFFLVLFYFEVQGIFVISQYIPWIFTIVMFFYVVLFAKKAESKIEPIPESKSEVKEERKETITVSAPSPFNVKEYYRNSTFVLLVLCLILLFFYDSYVFVFKMLLYLGLALYVLVPVIIYFSKQSSQEQLEFEKELERKKQLGIKPGVMDELNLKSLLIIFILAPIIAITVIFILALLRKVF
jgi:Ca2+/Na+ antiporter